MFEWQKNQIKKLSIEKDILEEELNKNIKTKEELEQLEIVKEYIKLLQDENICQYIKLLEHIQKKEESINNRNISIKKFNQDICYHQNLSFISDETNNHQEEPNYQYYRCQCLDCGYITDFKFYNGERLNTKLINPSLKENKLILKK